MQLGVQWQCNWVFKFMQLRSEMAFLLIQTGAAWPVGYW